MNSLELFIKSIPKAELHLHIEGTLEPELMFALAKRNNLSLSYTTVEELKRAYHFHNLKQFLDIYYQGTQALLHEQDFYDLTFAYFTKSNADNILHTEFFFDPQAHTERGVAFDTVIRGIQRAREDALQEYNITSKLIMCFLRNLDEANAFRTLETALPYKEWIYGVGLDSYEVGNPPSKFAGVFQKALELGFVTVAHAGEEGPADYVWEALDLLKSRRIDHGVRSMDDPALIEYLVKNKIPLTVCPLSNVKLRVFQKMSDHNIKRMLDQGVCVTINSDDPAYFGGYMNENFAAAQEGVGFSRSNLIKICENSIDASFLGAERKKILKEELAAYALKDIRV